MVHRGDALSLHQSLPSLALSHDPPLEELLLLDQGDHQEHLLPTDCVRARRSQKHIFFVIRIVAECVILPYEY